MISITVYRDKSDGSNRGFKIQGHSGYAKSGFDIICAAVSATAYNALNGLEEIAGLKDFYEISDSGMINCKVPSKKGMNQKTAETAEVILRLTVMGFEQLCSQHGKYISTLNEEV